MGLDMKSKNKVCEQIYKRYQRESKKGKGKMLKEYSLSLNMNRDYLAHKLSNWGKTRYAVVNGKTVKFTAKEPVRSRPKAAGGKKTGRPEKYHKAFVKALVGIWEFFDYPCGKLLAPLIKSALSFLILEFSLALEFRELFESVSPSTIDRKLKKEKKRYRIKGISTTKKGTLLKSQIPVRVYFDWDERKPGFFEGDTVSHCGTRASGQFCQSLMTTDVGSGWTEPRALLNNARL
jgi:hypothetical protein